MATLLFFLILLSILIFVYESIILPSVRLRIRYQIFALRDKLRFLKIEKGNALDDEAFAYSQDCLNTLLAFLHRYDFSAMVRAALFFRKNPTLYKEALEEQRRILQKCDVEEFHRIIKEYTDLAILSVTANSFGLLLVLAPFLITAIAVKGLKYIIGKAKEITTNLLSVSEKESDLLDRICLG